MPIRQLRPGEKIPAGQPRRYKSSNGYMRLRWRIAPNTYVETYEHRVFEGAVTTAEHVHHLNHDRTDNRPENLEPLSAWEHYMEHASPYADEAIRLYQEGLSAGAVAEKIGIQRGQVYAFLEVRGIPRRKVSDYRPTDRDDQIRDLHSQGIRPAEIAERLETSPIQVRRALDRMGVPRARKGSHGSLAYFKAGCRCQVCDMQCPHGTPGGFQNWRCKCDPCRDARIAYQRERRKIRRELGL